MLQLSYNNSSAKVIQICKSSAVNILQYIVFSTKKKIVSNSRNSFALRAFVTLACKVRNNLTNEGKGQTPRNYETNKKVKRNISSHGNNKYLKQKTTQWIQNISQWDSGSCWVQITNDCKAHCKFITFLCSSTIL